jgi:hypothetical protein
MPPRSQFFSPLSAAAFIRLPAGQVKNLGQNRGRAARWQFRRQQLRHPLQPDWVDAGLRVGSSSIAGHRYADLSAANILIL